MTTDELLNKLPAAIGNHKENGFYILSKPTDQYEGLYLHNDGKDWLASYGVEGEFVCMNPEAPDENGFYNNAFAYGKTPNEALQGLYDWCVRNGFIKAMTAKEFDKALWTLEQNIEFCKQVHDACGSIL